MDGIALDLEFHGRPIDGWWFDFDAKPLGLVAKLGKLVGVAHVQRHRRGHELDRVVSFHVGGLISDQRVRGGVALVEPVIGKAREQIENGFGGEQSYKAYADVLETLGCRNGDRLFDFGCSWGYGSWQLARHGFDVQSFEISQPRGQYAREKLGIDVVHSLNDAHGPFDLAAHRHVHFRVAKGVDQR